MKTILRHACSLWMILLLGSALIAPAAETEPPADAPDKKSEAPAEAPAKAPEKKPEPPPAHTVQSGALELKTQLDAIVESSEMQPISVDTESWALLVVEDAVSHGQDVKQGEILLKLETDKIEEQIQNLEHQQPDAAIALELAEAELANLEQTTPLKLEASQRAHQIAIEDYDYFQKVGRAQREKSSRFSVKSAEERLDGAREELKQLKQMYEADDLTEETEEIVLRRQIFAVEAAEYSLEFTRLNSKFTLETSLPRDHENLRNQKRDQGLALELAEITIPRALAQKRLALAKLKRDQKDAQEKLAELKADLKSMRVRAAKDGLIYYGASEGGKWVTGPVLAKKLVPGGKIMPREVVMTLVNPERLQLSAVVPEGELYKLKAGARGKATAVSAPSQKMNVHLKSLQKVPLVSGGYGAELALEKTEGVQLMPGMTCKVTFEQTRKTDHLLAPKEAVFQEDGASVVYLAKEDKPEKRKVETGLADAQQIEILEGLSAGDKILLKKPD